MIARAIGTMLAMTTSAVEASPPAADKVMVLVPAEGCDLTLLHPRVEAVGGTLTRDRRTTRVSVDWPADPARNLDLAGKPSPFAVAVEASAPTGALPSIARRIEVALGKNCKPAIYFVHERRMVTTPRTWALGEPAPASKTLVTLNRKSGASAEDFERLWAFPHAQLALAWRALRGGEGHYVQNLVVGRATPSTPMIDGIGESEGPGVPTPQERDIRMKTAAHAATFQNLRDSSMFVVREVTLKDGRP